MRVRDRVRDRVKVRVRVRVRDRVRDRGRVRARLGLRAADSHRNTVQRTRALVQSPLLLAQRKVPS